MPSFVESLWKPVEWVAQGKASLEVAAVGAGFLTVHWLSRRFSEKPEEPREMELAQEMEPLEGHRGERCSPSRWDSDMLCEADREALPRVTSHKLDLVGSEVTLTETESLAPRTESACFADHRSETSSVVSLSSPESQFITRGLLLDDARVPKIEAPSCFSMRSYCCCFGAKIHAMPPEDVYRKEPAPLFLVSQ